VVSDATAALTALRANPGLPTHGVIVLCDFGGSGTSITLADAATDFAPIGETVRYPEFSGDLIDQALLTHDPGPGEGGAGAELGQPS
jgi:molecular chaperone DnaK (HSP70)